jgi:ligand-binding SRPBCC domain-containing protein
MEIIIKTYVNQPLQSVWQGFDENLFVKLAPPFPPVRLLRFDGSEKGNEVHLELNFLLFRQTWVSLITENVKTDDQIYFVDEGIKLPFFIKYWKHRHRIIKHIDKGKGTQSLIIDEVEFKSWLGWLIYPVLYFQFWYRKGIYEEIFK